MKAAVYNEYGGPEVFKITDVEKPIPKDGEVLIKIHATSVTAGDVNARDFSHVPKGLKFMGKLMFGIRKPRKQIIGCVFSGEVVVVGKKVNSFKVGDEVFGIDGERLGVYAEFKTMSEDGAISMKPTNISHMEAASVPFGASTAIYFLKEGGKIKSGHKVLIVGASGNVGTAAVQIAKSYGAEVTGVCSTSNIGLVKSLGADHIIDYKKENWLENGETYDLIVDTVSNVPFSKIKGSLKENGKLLAVAGGIGEMLKMVTTKFGKKKVVFGGGASCEKKEYQVKLKELIEAGKYKSVIDSTFSLDEMVEAHRHYDKGHLKGNVVISVVEE